ncbi:lysine decarboxylation/transport transcriptional activator CadC [Vibrio aestuarianus]|uniref:lysine decarboxylation/transport transcriptional activator CadC n=1 Tax=Vibrio aestuarianus TaxID=28171 RepID=UPI00237C9855|nr:lysine decarboxylation/transport transcriptional activator CadC [Vibrio aestuarianus]MDE1237391.1 lysine decarboxylation/transport transcriptional activator CadC [Vibrio aestuarianus]
MVGMYFQINDWILSVDENKLYRQDREVAVEPRLINLLYFLARNSGEVFCREELIEHVWNGAIVTDQVVTQSIFELRKLLRDGREENINYLTTVPKRGYKLMANVSEITSEQFVQQRVGVVASNEPVKDLSVSETPHSETSEIINEVSFPAAPLTRALSYRSKANPRLNKTGQVSRWKSITLDIMWVSVLIVAFALFTYHQSATKITQAMDTHLIEFRLQNSFSKQASNDELADGVVQKLMADIIQVSDYRVHLSQTPFSSGIVPGKSVTVEVKEQANKAYLDVEYRSNASNTILFSRQYSLATSQLHHVMEQASFDLMQALDVPNAEQKASQLMQGLPSDHQALTLLIHANHYLNLSKPQDFKHAIALLERVLKIEPHNAYVQAELLIAYYVQLALDPALMSVNEQINVVSQTLSHELEQTQHTLPARVYEALALHEMVSDNPDKAQVYLQLSLEKRSSVLSYVLLGKLSELKGDRERASDAYSEAFYMNTSMETYMLCENLAFYSNLKSIDYALYRSVHPSVVPVI